MDSPPLRDRDAATVVAPWSPERGREIAAVIQFVVTPSNSRPLRVFKRDGTVHMGTSATSLHDILVVTGGQSRIGVDISLSEVARIERRELRLGRAFLLGLVTTLLAATVGAFVLNDPTDSLRLTDGVYLGALLGAFLGALIVWLLQDWRALHRWHAVLPESRIGTK